MTPQAGDVVLTRGPGLIERAIRWAEGRRYGPGSEYARWNHAAMLFDGQGNIVEAYSGGLMYAHLDRYAPDSRVVLRPPYPDGGGAAAARAIASLVGRVHYDFLEVGALALAYLTGTRLRFGLAGTAICSGAVAYAVAAGGVDLGPDEEWMSPADLMLAARAGSWPAVWPPGYALPAPPAR